MNAIAVQPQQSHSFQGHEIRVVMRDGEPWFVAKDVMASLDYSAHSAPAKVCEHIPDEWRGVNPIHTPGGLQKLLCLAEPGLYFFLGRSDKQAALPFQKWVYGEVLPSIRKTGSYTANPDSVVLTDHQTYMIWFLIGHFCNNMYVYDRYSLYASLTRLGSQAGIEMRDHFLDGFHACDVLQRELAPRFKAACQSIGTDYKVYGRESYERLT